MKHEDDDAKDRAEKLHDERAKAAQDPKERAKVEKTPVEPLLGEPGGKAEEWD